MRNLAYERTRTFLCLTADALAWRTATTALMAAVTVLRWRVLGFGYSGRMVQAVHELRTRQSEQLQRTPQEVIQDRRAGEVNATLLGKGDENLNCTQAVLNLILTAAVTPPVTLLTLLAVDWCPAPTAAEPEYIPDTGYFTATDIATCAARDQTVYVSMPNRTSPAERAGRLPPSDFDYDAEQDCYRCPGGQLMHAKGDPSLEKGVLR